MPDIFESANLCRVLGVGHLTIGLQACVLVM
jgi:hypothetical protein